MSKNVNMNMYLEVKPCRANVWRPYNEVRDSKAEYRRLKGAFQSEAY